MGWRRSPERIEVVIGDRNPKTDSKTKKKRITVEIPYKYLE